MSLSVGIVGLPNVGKSTLFNVLLKKQVSAEGNYPFTTIKPHTGVVAVPDPKFDQLVQLIKPQKNTPATVTFVDIAGLVKNAHKGEGLGNEFLGQIRNVDAIVHVIRAFEDDDVPHAMETIDPDRDREIISIELELAGINKPMVEWINSDISDFDKVDDLITQVYELLGLITFYTIKGGSEVRASSLKKGSTALAAAAAIHTDFAERFIKSEVINVEQLLRMDDWKKAKEKGLVRLEGKDYMVQDGDVIEFKVGV